MTAKDWEELLFKAKWAQKDLAKELDKGPGTISGMINHTSGPYAGGRKLRKRAMELLRARIASLESEELPSRISEVSAVELRERPLESDTELWKRRAKENEARIHRMRSGLRALLDLDLASTSSSDPETRVAEVLEELFARVEEKAAREQRPEERPGRPQGA